MGQSRPFLLFVLIKGGPHGGDEGRVLGGFIQSPNWEDALEHLRLSYFGATLYPVFPTAISLPTPRAQEEKPEGTGLSQARRLLGCGTPICRQHLASGLWLFGPPGGLLVPCPALSPPAPMPQNLARDPAAQSPKCQALMWPTMGGHPTHLCDSGSHRSPQAHTTGLCAWAPCPPSYHVAPITRRPFLSWGHLSPGAQHNARCAVDTWKDGEEARSSILSTLGFSLGN